MENLPNFGLANTVTGFATVLRDTSPDTGPSYGLTARALGSRLLDNRGHRRVYRHLARLRRNQPGVGRTLVLGSDDLFF